MLIPKRLIIASLVGLSLPLISLTSGFTFKTADNDIATVTIGKPAKKSNFDVLQSPFTVIDRKPTKQIMKHHTKKVKKSVVKSDYTQPVEQSEQQSIPVQQPVQDTAPQTTSNAEQSAGEQIAQAESSGSYTAQNGRYYGKYQLDISYLHGDLSPENQERTFVQYCKSRYGSVENALIFRQIHNWY